MKSRRVLNFVLMMVAAGWRRSEIVSLVESLRRLSDSELSELLLNANHFQEELSASFFSARGDVFYSSPISIAASSDIDEKVIRLLRVEAGLSVMESVRSMSQGLRKVDRARAAELPGYSKQSLGSWVRRAAEVFSPSELLYVATSIRNASVHGTQLDWGLRKNES